MVVQIICDTVMFLSYIAIIAVTVYWLIDLPKKLKALADECANLRERDRQKKFQHVYIGRLSLLVLFHLCSTALDIVMSALSNGLSDTENNLIVPAIVALVVLFVLCIFLFVYTGIFRKKYSIRTRGDLIIDITRNHAADMLLSIFISILFAINSAFVLYSILFF